MQQPGGATPNLNYSSWAERISSSTSGLARDLFATDGPVTLAALGEHMSSTKGRSGFRSPQHERSVRRRRTSVQSHPYAVNKDRSLRTRPHVTDMASSEQAHRSASDLLNQHEQLQMGVGCLPAELGRGVQIRKDQGPRRAKGKQPAHSPTHFAGAMSVDDMNMHADSSLLGLSSGRATSTSGQVMSYQDYDRYDVGFGSRGEHVRPFELRTARNYEIAETKDIANNKTQDFTHSPVKLSSSALTHEHPLESFEGGWTARNAASHVSVASARTDFDHTCTTRSSAVKERLALILNHVTQQEQTTGTLSRYHSNGMVMLDADGEALHRITTIERELQHVNRWRHEPVRQDAARQVQNGRPQGAEETDRDFPEFHCPWISCHHRFASVIGAINSGFGGTDYGCVHAACLETFPDLNGWREHVVYPHHDLLDPFRDQSGDTEEQELQV
ncbi:hypothetical protein LTR50_004171 [Elasticomyces elasticus]|nr:hypothetical protein LTR50_004171 [Elasticomyces elasticus]